MFDWKNTKTWTSPWGSAVMNLTSVHEDMGLIPGPAQWLKESGVTMSCGVSCRHSWDLVLLWLWCRLATAALIWPLAWELPYALGAALKKQKIPKHKTQKTKHQKWLEQHFLLRDSCYVKTVCRGRRKSRGKKCREKVTPINPSKRQWPELQQQQWRWGEGRDVEYIWEKWRG